MPTNGYCTVPDYKAWITVDDTVDDVVIDRAISAASRGIDNFCKTRFWKTTAGTVRLFDTCDPHRVRIGDTVAITEIATDRNRDGVYDDVWTAADYQLLPLNPAAAPEPQPYTEVTAIGSLTFPQLSGAGSRQGLIRITGTWGWPAIPDAVFEAALLIVNRLVKRRGSPEGVAGFDEFGTVRISARDDPDAVRYLTPYKTSRRQGGWALA